MITPSSSQKEATVTAQSNSQNVKVGIEQGAARMFVKAGGVLDIETGGAFSQNGQVLKFARGQLTTVTAADTVVTGLATVVAVVASLESDPTDNPFMASAQIGDQAGAPAAGAIIIKTWQNSAGTDPTPAAATTFGKKVNWVAIGT
jgi:hypothetical protein